MNHGSINITIDNCATNAGSTNTGIYSQHGYVGSTKDQSPVLHGYQFRPTLANRWSKHWYFEIASFYSGKIIGI